MELQTETYIIKHRELATQHKREWENRKQELIKAAKFACDNGAFSYRNFLVGAALLGWSESQKKYFVALAGNYKAEKRVDLGEDQRCAERGAIDYLLAKAPDAKIVGMVVASEQTGTAAEIQGHTKTLHCCQQCRIMLKQKECVEKNAPVITVNHSGETDIVEEMKIQDMLDMYDTREAKTFAA